jgi:hypothetical protein
LFDEYSGIKWIHTNSSWGGGGGLAANGNFERAGLSIAQFNLRKFSFILRNYRRLQSAKLIKCDLRVFSRGVTMQKQRGSTSPTMLCSEGSFNTASAHSKETVKLGLVDSRTSEPLDK